MRTKRGWLVAIALVVGLVGAACGDDGDGQDRAQEPQRTTTTARKAGRFQPGTAMANIQAKGKIVVGTKFDQPGFGLKNPTTNEVEGFDVEVAKLIALDIFGGTMATVDDKIEFVEAVSKNREPFIQEGRVDMVVATYTINDARKQVVDFAGPYFVAQQDIMVKKADRTINDVDDLNGKPVCTVKGSTSQTNLEGNAPQSRVTLFDTYSQCAEALTDGRVVAVTTDNTILAGLVQQSNGAFKLIDAPFSQEPYGIGLKKGDEAFREFLNDRLEEIFKSGEWAAAFRATLGKIGLKTPAIPRVDRYVAGAATTTAPRAPTTSSTTSTSTSTTTSSTTTTTS